MNEFATRLLTVIINSRIAGSPQVPGVISYRWGGCTLFDQLV
jgi:hypothetical protein